MSEENVYKKIEELLGQLPQNFSVLEEEVDINLQMEYFEFVKRNCKEVSAEVLEKKEQLFDTETEEEEKKLLLAQLANLDDVAAFRLLEKYFENPEPELRSWALLSLQSSKMLLESSLLGENQVFISTGLGGKGTKLRYFVVLSSKTGEPFTDVQQKIIKGEFGFTLKNFDAELESLDRDGKYTTLLAIVPIKVSIKILFKKAVEECNNFGDFVNQNFIVTNVKKMTEEEIDKFFADAEKNKDTPPEI